MATQKPTIILIAVTASLVSFLAGYLLTQPKSSINAVVQEQRGNLIDRFDGVVQTSSPTPLPPGLLQASSDTVLAPTNAPEGEAVLYYHTGGVSRLDLETRKTSLISQAALPGLTRVIWSPDRNRVITVTRSSTGPRYSYFDYTTHEHGSLGANVLDVVFSPDGSEIAIARNPGGGEGAIQISSFKGENTRTILKTRLDNIKLFWPQPSLLAFKASDTGQGTESLYTLTKQGDLNQVLGGADRLSVRWAPGGQSFLYSQQETSGIRLRAFDLLSKLPRLLPIQTLAENCAWSLNATDVTCATQTGGETSVVRIALSSLSSTILFSHLIITPQEVFLSSLENFLVITSAADQTLSAVKLTAN